MEKSDLICMYTFTINKNHHHLTDIVSYIDYRKSRNIVYNIF